MIQQQNLLVLEDYIEYEDNEEEDGDEKRTRTPFFPFRHA
jgi:hypothetical protein